MCVCACACVQRRLSGVIGVPQDDQGSPTAFGTVGSYDTETGTIPARKYDIYG